MIILEKSDCILFYSINPKYFDKFDTVSCRSKCGSFWRTSESETAIFKYDLNFRSIDEQSNEAFIEYKSRMAYTVKIENEKKDALEILALIKEFHLSMHLFIKNNSLLHFSKLDLQVSQTVPPLTNIEANIAKLRDMTPYEDKSELEKKIEKDIENMEFDVRILRDRINI